jgi:uncharacterized integral membrane protein
MSDNELEQQSGAAAAPEPVRTHRIARSGTSFAWTTAFIGAVALAALIVFIAENSSAVHVSFLGMHAKIALGLALLLAALIGGVLVLIVGSLRIRELRRTASRHSEQDMAAMRRFGRRQRPASPTD